LLLVPVLVFWILNFYLGSILPQNVFIRPAYYKMSVFLSMIIIVMSAIPFYFYYRIRKNDVTGTRLTNFYFPLSMVLMVFFVVTVFLIIVSLNYGSTVYVDLVGFRTDSRTIDSIFGLLLIIYPLVQVIFIIDSIYMIKRYRQRRKQLIEQIGQDK